MISSKNINQYLSSVFHRLGGQKMPTTEISKSPNPYIMKVEPKNKFYIKQRIKGRKPTNHLPKQGRYYDIKLKFNIYEGKGPFIFIKLKGSWWGSNRSSNLGSLESTLVNVSLVINIVEDIQIENTPAKGTCIKSLFSSLMDMIMVL